MCVHVVGCVATVRADVLCGCAGGASQAAQRTRVCARAPTTLAPHSAIAVLSHVPAALWYTLRALLGVLIRSGRGGPANYPILCTGLL